MAEDAETFHAMQAPAIRICTAAVPVPFSPPLEDFDLPGVGEVQAALRRAAGAGSGVLS